MEHTASQKKQNVMNNPTATQSDRLSTHSPTLRMYGI